MSPMCAMVIVSCIASSVPAQAPEPGPNCGAELSGCMSTAWSTRDGCINAPSTQLETDMQQCSDDHERRVEEGASPVASGIAWQMCIDQAFQTNGDRLMQCARTCANDIGQCLSDYAACLAKKMIGAFG